MAKRSTKSARAKKGSKKKKPVEVEPEEEYDPYADNFEGPLTKRRFGLRFSWCPTTIPSTTGSRRF